MLTVKRFSCEGLERGCVTDEARPRFSFALESDRPGARLERATLEVNGWRLTTTDQVGLRYDGVPLEPRRVYHATLSVVDDAGEVAEAELDFETGLMGTAPRAQWISDAGYIFTEKGTSPVPMVFRRRFELRGAVGSARVYATAMGIYDLELNGQRVGDAYFSPGFTSYETTLQYQVHDVSDLLGKSNELVVTVAGEQTFSPRLTYMGFRYVSVEGVDRDHLRVAALALYSDLRETGSFSCSDERLNRLQENIRWGAKSNFVDIPTDCPQRDERMGWTGDIAVFAPTSCYNFDMGRFLRKWLRDVRSEQRRGGGIPVTVPAQGFGFPTTIPAMAVDFWGDACVLVPWALYQAEGDEDVLRENFDTMKRYVDACRFWAGLGVGDHHYIWHTPAPLHFGDWVAPDVPQMGQWQARSKWTATASLRNTSSLVARIAHILGDREAEERYGRLSERVARAYENVFTDGGGRLKEEFQTAYVLPIHYRIFQGENLDHAVDNLVRLVEKSHYCIGTGFPGTPYILFALADNGRADVAYKMLMNTACPSWLYEVVMGATTIWERWDGLDENGECPIGDDGTDLMISYNHYASGAVGDFLYRRVAGIEPEEAGYRRFSVRPLVGGGLTSASGSLETPYGTARSSWSVQDGVFSIEVEVPLGTTCDLTLPDGEAHELSSGRHAYACALPEEAMR